MGLQTQVKRELPRGKQNMHLIGYFADSTPNRLFVNSARIVNVNGGIDRREVMLLLLAKHPAGTEILFHSVSDIGLQDFDVTEND